MNFKNGVRVDGKSLHFGPGSQQSCLLVGPFPCACPLLAGTGAVDFSLEGGTELAQQLGEWAQVDVLRMDQGLPGSCMLLRGLLIGGLSARMILSFTNSQFPPPLRYVGLAEELPESLQGCSLSYLQDILEREGFRLQLLSGPYAAFVHDDLLGTLNAEGLARDVDEFAPRAGKHVYFSVHLAVVRLQAFFFCGCLYLSLNLSVNAIRNAIDLAAFGALNLIFQ